MKKNVKYLSSSGTCEKKPVDISTHTTKLFLLSFHFTGKEKTPFLSIFLYHTVLFLYTLLDKMDTQKEIFRQTNKRLKSWLAD